MCGIMGNFFDICISGFIGIYEWKLKLIFIKNWSLSIKRFSKYLNFLCWEVY